MFYLTNYNQTSLILQFSDLEWRPIVWRHSDFLVLVGLVNSNLEDFCKQGEYSRQFEKNFLKISKYKKTWEQFFPLKLCYSKMRVGLTKPSSCLSKETRARHAWAHLPTNATLRPKTRATARQRALAAITFSGIWMFKTKRDQKSTFLVLYFR